MNLQDGADPQSYSSDRPSLCPACGWETSTGRIIARVPVFLFPVPQAVASTIEHKELRILSCAHCGHLFQPDVSPALLQRIYETYYAHYPLSQCESFNQTYRTPFDRLFANTLKKLGIHGGRLLEIGCSSPANLENFARLGFSCVGVDPSPLAAGRSHPNIQIVQGFYESSTTNGPFDVIVSRFNLEHIPDLDTHLSKIRSDLSPDGVAFVQVPNAEYQVRRGQPFFFAHEHIHYFNLASLGALFARHGMNLIGGGGEDDPSLVACFRVAASSSEQTDSSFHRAWDRHVAMTQTLGREVADRVRQAKHPVCYGCGMTLYWLLTLLDADQVADMDIVEDNTALHGLRAPGFTRPIGPPDRDLLARADLVMLTLSPLYHDQVQLRLAQLCPDSVALLISDGQLRLVDRIVAAPREGADT